MLAALLLAALPQESATPAPWTWDDFPVFVWRQRYRGAELPERLVSPFGGTNVERDDAAGWARERGLAFYVGHAPGRNALHLDGGEPWDARVKSWIDTRDEALLVRTPCLTDPETRAELFATLERTLLARDGDHGLGISLGDEIGLTPNGNPLDMCRSVTCEALWRTYAEANGWPETAPTTDAVRVSLGEDDFGLLGAWLGRRRFHRAVLTDLVAELADRARALAPGVDVGLLGISGVTAFGGVPVDPAPLDFVEVYPLVEARQRLATLRSSAGAPRALATVFLTEETPDGAAWQVWEHWARGGDGIVVWNDAKLEDSTTHRERLAQAVADIRRVAARFPDAPPPYPAGVALVHDADSVAASWLRDALLDGPTWPRRFAGYQREHGNRERIVTAWLTALERLGIQPGVVALSEINVALTRRFPLLVLPRIVVTDQADLDRLSAHLKRGGAILSEQSFWVDRGGRPLSNALEAQFHALGRHRFLGSDILVEDEEARRAVVELSLMHHGKLLGESRGGPAENVVTEPAGFPLLRTRRRISPDVELVAVLQDERHTSSRTARLRDLELVIAPPEGWRMTWIHPAGSSGTRATLRAGDAAVVLFERD